MTSKEERQPLTCFQNELIDIIGKICRHLRVSLVQQIIASDFQ